MGNFSAVPLAIAGVVLIRPRRFMDARGWFSEVYRRDALAELGVTADFVQDNESLSRATGTVRGLHFQVPPQAKLVRVVAGAVFDVAVDLRRGSPDFGKWVGATLTAESGEQLFIPAGFAHGFCTLRPDTLVGYKVDAAYAPAGDAGIAWDDPDLGIAWPVAPGAAVLSEKDAKLPRLAAITPPFAMEPA